MSCSFLISFGSLKKTARWNVKQPILIALFAVQAFLVSPAHAWFPEGLVEFATDARPYCPPSVSSEHNQEEKKKEQGQTEEEPDCE